MIVPIAVLAAVSLLIMAKRIVENSDQLEHNDQRACSHPVDGEVGKYQITDRMIADYLKLNP